MTRDNIMNLNGQIQLLSSHRIFLEYLHMFIGQIKRDTMTGIKYLKTGQGFEPNKHNYKILIFSSNFKHDKR